MTEEKQIEEMALTLSEGSCGNECDCIQGDKFNCHLLHSASVLYSAGYRKQREGEWISNELGGYEYAFYCSECGWVDGFPFNDRHKYCPNCGVHMKGVGNEQK